MSMMYSMLVRCCPVRLLQALARAHMIAAAHVVHDQRHRVDDRHDRPGGLPEDDVVAILLDLRTPR